MAAKRTLLKWRKDALIAQHLLRKGTLSAEAIKRRLGDSSAIILALTQELLDQLTLDEEVYNEKG